MKLTYLFLPSLALALACAAGDGTGSSIAFSNPQKPMTVRMHLREGQFHVQGSDVTSVTINTDGSKPQSPPPRADGLRVLTDTNGPRLSEKDNVVEFSYDTEVDEATPNHRIIVPRRAGVEIYSDRGAILTVEAVDGAVDVYNQNGTVVLNDLGGAVSVETQNGPINASFRRLPEKPLSFSSTNGDVTLHVPSESRANVQFRTRNGSVLTDFPEEVLKVQTMADRGKFKPVKSKRKDGDSDVAREMENAAREAARKAAEISHDVAEQARQLAQAAREGIAEAKGEPRPPKPPRAPRAPIPPATGGKIVSGTLNGGGTDLQVITLNGSIVMRKLTTEVEKR